MATQQFSDVITYAIAVGPNHGGTGYRAGLLEGDSLCAPHHHRTRNAAMECGQRAMRRAAKASSGPAYHARNLERHARNLERDARYVREALGENDRAGVQRFLTVLENDAARLRRTLYLPREEGTP